MNLKRATLAGHLGEHVSDTDQVVLGPLHSSLGLDPLALEAIDPRDLVDQDPSLFRLCVDDKSNSTLLDDRVSPGADTRVQKERDDVLPSALGAVDEITRSAVSIESAAHLDLSEALVLSAEGAVFVVKRDVDLSNRCRLPSVRAGENHVLHRLTPQETWALLTQGPANGIDDVALATAIGTDNTTDPWAKLKDGLVHEGLESSQLDATNSHSRDSPPVSAGVYSTRALSPESCCLRRKSLLGEQGLRLDLLLPQQGQFPTRVLLTPRKGWSHRQRDLHKLHSPQTGVLADHQPAMNQALLEDTVACIPLARDLSQRDGEVRPRRTPVVLVRRPLLPERLHADTQGLRTRVRQFLEQRIFQCLGGSEVDHRTSNSLTNRLLAGAALQDLRRQLQCGRTHWCIQRCQLARGFLESNSSGHSGLQLRLLRKGAGGGRSHVDVVGGDHGGAEEDDEQDAKDIESSGARSHSPDDPVVVATEAF